jgi:hypothetical protein
VQQICQEKETVFNSATVSGAAIMLKVENINSALLHKLKNKAM